ncbi:MAG TPA: HEPN domain-containing protein [Vicinamibacterales bacterium]|nr:HEPN domain-containing protein [Vicinamibacterales bacterium]
MTDENRKRNIADELKRADEALRAARALLNGELYADAISRAYYGAFHSLRALLLSRGIEPKTHGGALHVFNTEFVRPGLFPSSYNRLLGGMQRSRELADYDAAVTFSRQDAEACLRDAEAFGSHVVQHLRDGQWIP